MSTSNPRAGSTWRRRTTALGLVAAGAVAGGILAGTLTASATGPSGTQPSSPAVGGMPMPGQGPRDMRGHVEGPRPVRSDEKSLSTDKADKVKAAAEKAVSGGTVYRVETDAGDGVYEAHMTKSDGTPVTVKLDRSIRVTKVEDGMGVGDPGPGR